jgi:O-antigen/teichoic acid export membrane protein
VSLRQRTVHGIAWTLVTRVATQIASYAVSVALARMLLPADFGLVGMIGVFTGFASVFIDFGIGSAIVQRKEISREQLSSGFWATLAMGAILTALFVVGAPLIARFYGRMELTRITQVCAFTFLLSSIGIVPRSLFVREMKIKQLMLFDLSVSLSGGLVSVALAISGAGVWTIVVASLWTAAGQSLLPLVAGKWRPSGSASFEDLKPLLAIGLGLLGFSVINYWARNFDNLIVGSLMGETQLGIYSRGYSLMLLPISQIGATLGGSLLPALSKMHEDKARSARVFLRILRLMSFAAFPAMVGLCVVADPFVRALYGVKWLGLIPVLRVLALVGALQATTNPTGWLYIAQGRTDRLFRWGLAANPLVILALYLGARAGSIFTVAVAYLVINMILAIPCLWLAVSLVDLGIFQVLRVVWSPLAHTIIMAAAVLLVGRVLPMHLATSARLLIQVSTGAASYAISNIALRSAAFLDLKQQLSGRSLRADPTGVEA